jgi:hypothetical protein
MGNDRPFTVDDTGGGKLSIRPWRYGMQENGVEQLLAHQRLLRCSSVFAQTMYRRLH